MSNVPVFPPLPTTTTPAPASETAAIMEFIVAQVGDTPTGLLVTHMTTAWVRNAEKALIHPRLQEAYYKRDLIDLALGYYRAQVDVTLGTDMAQKRSQRFMALETLRADAHAEIEKVEKIARARRGIAIGLVAAAAPVTPPIPIPTNPYADANSPTYAGSPYVTSGTRNGSRW